MILAHRPKRAHGFRPVLAVLEDRALMSVAAHHPVKASATVHKAATTATVGTVTTSVSSITPLNDAGGYRFLDFNGPTPGVAAGSGTNSNGIANNGTVVGYTIADNGNFSNFTARPTRNTRATVANINGATKAAAFGINNSNTIVGTDGNGGAFTLTGRTVRTFLPTGASSATAFGINDRGTVVGQEVVGAASPGFIRVRANSFITVNAPSGPNTVNVQGINNNGLAVGFYLGTNGQAQGLIVNQRSARAGAVTATAVADPTIPAVAAEPGATFVFSQILGVNDRGIAVGYYGDSTTSQHGFLYNTKTGQYTFLDDPNVAFNNGVEVTQITGITNSGEITGFYSDAAGVFHGFVATTVTNRA